MGAKSSTIRDVAKKAGVSITTVSKVINKGGGISEGTIQRVEKAIRELKYTRSLAFAGRRTTQALIGLIIPDVEMLNPYYLGILKGVYDTSGTYDCGIYMRVTEGYRDAGEGLREEMRGVGAQGVLFIPSVATRAAALGPISEWPQVVFVDRTLEGVAASSITVDNREGARQAARYLLKLGHARLAYVGGPVGLSTERDKRDGFTRALAESGAELLPENVLEGGYALHSARDAMAHRLRGCKRTFSAVFVTSDSMAFGVKEALDGAGLRVPEDVSLVGYDDIPFSAALGLTTVGQPAYLMGQNALVMLMDLIGGRISLPRHDVLLPGLSIRTTCRLCQDPRA